MKLWRLCILAAAVCGLHPVFAAGPDLTSARSTARDFLTSWYIKQDFEHLWRLIAPENQFVVPEIHSTFRAVEQRAAWLQIFRWPFRTGLQLPSRLEDVIEYPLTTRVGSDTLRPLNLLDGTLQDPFAVLDPESLPAGSVFPDLNASPARRAKFDLTAKYLDRLHRTYKGKIYLTLYVTKAPWFRGEGVLLYWVNRGSNYRLAALHPTN